MDVRLRLDQIIEELGTESDRGCILVAASALELYLEELLRAALSADAHIVKNAINPLFEQMGPLSSFSAKIKMAYGLGLISRRNFSDLEKIRKIRNLAAHKHSAMTFENRPIVDISSTLEGMGDAANLLPKELVEYYSTTLLKAKSKERARFTLTVSWVVAAVEVKKEKLMKVPRTQE